MIRRFWFGVPILSGLMLVAVSAVILMTGCGKKKDVASDKKVESQTVTQEQKQMDLGLKKVKLETSMGDIVIELNEEAAPVTVKNFLRYVEEGRPQGHFQGGVVDVRREPGQVLLDIAHDVVEVPSNGRGDADDTGRRVWRSAGHGGPVDRLRRRHARRGQAAQPAAGARRTRRRRRHSR